MRKAAKQRSVTVRQKKSYWEFVNSIVRSLQSNLYMHKWTFTLRQAKELDEGCNCGSQALAEISILTRYFRATITCHPELKRMFMRGQYDQVARTLIHEFCHILTEPLYDTSINGVTNTASEFLEYIREQSTQHIAIILYDLLPPNIYSVYRDKTDK